MNDQPRTLPYRKFPITNVEVTRHEGVPVRSTFPHPLVTFDWDADGNLLHVGILGSDLRVETDNSDPLNLLPGNPHLKLDREAYARGDDDPFIRESEPA